MLGINDIDLIVKQLAEDFVAHLSAFQTAGHPAIDENPDHVRLTIRLPLDPVPGESDRPARLVLQLKAATQISHHLFYELSVFARSRRVNRRRLFGPPAERVSQVISEDADDNLHHLFGLVKFEIHDADVNLVKMGCEEWGVGNGE